VSVILAIAMTMFVMTGCTGQTALVTVKTDKTKTEEAKIEETKTEETKTEETKAEAAMDDSVYLGRGEVGSKWHASCIQEAVSRETEVSLKDDFFTAVNLDYLTGLTPKDGESSAGVNTDADRIMRDRALKILQKENPKTLGGELVKQFYGLATDWEAREQMGLAPAMAMLERIQAIRTIDDITAYEMSTGDVYRRQLLWHGVTKFLADPDYYTVAIDSTDLLLSDSQEYSERSEDGKLEEEFNKKTVSYVLKRFGISDKEAD
jgi:putative endopeptidase